MRKQHWLWCLSCLLLPFATARADYRVDMIITLNRKAPVDVATTHGMPVQAPAPMAAIDISDTSGLQRAGIGLLPDAQFGLEGEWRKLRDSRFRPVLRQAWRVAQRSTATTLRVHDDFRYQVMPAVARNDMTEEQVLEIVPAQPAYERYRIEGKVLVQQSAGLRVTLDLQYQLPIHAAPADYPSSSTPMKISASELATLRLQGEKRVNLGQVNFFDHPLLGVLLRVTEAE